MSDKFGVWSFLRDVLSRGCSIESDTVRSGRSYEEHSARLDQNAREFADELKPRLADAARIATLEADRAALLAACEAIQTALSKYGGQISDLFCHDEQFNDAVEAVDSAIAKAKGTA